MSSELEKRYYEVMPEGFTQVVTTTAHGVKTVWVSGQVAPGETLAEQSKGLYAALERRLEKAGAGPGDVVRLTTFVVDYSPDKLRDAFAGFGAVFGGLEAPPAHTVVGVQALYQPEILIEVEATAVVQG